ncbi:MAG TPA: HAD domain-containing protein [Solirubrobacteraceae bacterium]|nr:HAD domain-containing protein [Solirubrobacteraceae bacterium]
MDSPRPLLLVDIDGVISLFGFPPTAPPAGTWQIVDGIAHLLSATAGEHLRELSVTFELAWCSGWEEKANEYLPHALGLSERLPHLSFAPAEPQTQGHWKLDAIDRYAGPERAVAWIDDAHDEHCRVWAEARGGPTLLITTEPASGLTSAHVRELLDWAREVPQLADTENTGGSRVATVDHVAPASPDPNRSPEVAPK